MDFLDAFKAAADPFKRSLLRQQQAAQSVDPVAQLRRAYFSRQLQSQVQPSMSQGPLPWDPGTSESMREAHPIERVPRIDPESQTPLGYIAKAEAGLRETLGGPLENIDAPLHGIQQAAIAFHGSPHKFDKFLMSKIGTGEGAQAYGHGLYFAEHADVAKAYAPRDAKSEAKLMKMYKAAEAKQDYDAMSVLEDAMLHKTPEELRSAYPEHRKLIDKIQKTYTDASNLYKVDIPDSEVAAMLDWDKPLSEQPEIWAKLREKFPAAPGPYGDRINLNGTMIDDSTTGQGVVQTLGWDKEASDFLNGIGIPGIKYLDQGSRGAGQGTRNFVKFSDENIKILDINGKPVAPEVAEKFHAPLVQTFASLAVEDLPKKGTLADFEAVFLSKLDDAGKREWNEWMGEYDPRGFTAEGKYTRDEFVNILQKFNDYAKGMIAGPK